VGNACFLFQHSAGQSPLFLATGTAHAQNETRTTIIKPFKTIPPDLSMHLGPAVYSTKTWREERQIINVPLKPIFDYGVLPPKAFDREYTGQMEITRVDEDGIKQKCRGLTVTGCAYEITDETCFVFIVYDDILNRQRMSYDAVFRHERAHCLGWRHDQYGKPVVDMSGPLIELGHRRLREIERAGNEAKVVPNWMCYIVPGNRDSARSRRAI
jgi:hypothetical protein